MKLVKASILIAGCVMGGVGCTSFSAHRMFADADSGFVMLAGDAEGIRAYNDGLNGLVTNTKSSPDVKSSYWQNREKETNVKIFKFSFGKTTNKNKGGR